jgi:hypothetical protein
MIPAPRHPIAKIIYDVLDKEMSKRKGKHASEWMENEIDVVWKIACRLANKQISRKDIENCESLARGHIDYHNKFSLHVAFLVEDFRKHTKCT